MPGGNDAPRPDDGGDEQLFVTSQDDISRLLSQLEAIFGDDVVEPKEW